MAVRPPVLCKLQKGQLIDTQKGFVDTFNWMVDYINNLRGGASRDDETSGKKDAFKIVVDNPLGDRPVIRPDGDVGGSIEIECVNSDGYVTSAKKIKKIVFKSGDNSNESFYVGRDDDGTATIRLDTFWKE